jgi:hypothetical protein
MQKRTTTWLPIERSLNRRGENPVLSLESVRCLSCITGARARLGPRARRPNGETLPSGPGDVK